MANPFLVLGGVAVGVITAGIGVLAVPGWIDNANDSAAINDLGNIRGAESAAILQLGEYTDDFAILRSGELGVKFQKSEGVTLIGLEADTNESWCASVQSKSGRFFAASNVQAAIATGPGAESAMTTAGCDPDIITEILDKAADGTGPSGKPVDIGTPGPDGGKFTGGGNGSNAGSGNDGGTGSGDTDVDPEPVAKTITWSINCPDETEVTVPLPGAFGTVTWSDGETYPIQGDFPTRTVPAGTDLKVSFNGEVLSKMMVAQGTLSGDQLSCFRALDSFGDGTGINMMLGAFQGMTNLTNVPATIPAGMVNMMSMFEGATSFNDDISGWDTSAVTEMRFVFKDATSFNKPLKSWDVGSATDMTQMFYGASAFNQPLDGWDTGNVTTMASMFWGATSFNSSVAGWDLSSLGDMSRIFRFASSFNQPLDSWDTSNVWDMTQVFYEATSFNQPIGGWDTGNVRYFQAIFYNATAMSHSVAGWDLSSAQETGSYYGSGLTADKVPASWR